MKKELKQRKNEPLHEWIGRLAPMMVGKKATEIREVLAEVSKTSYIEGSAAAFRSAKTGMLNI